LLVAGLWAVTAVFAPAPAGAAPAAFSVTGDVDLVPGTDGEQRQVIMVDPHPLKVKVDLPADLAGHLSAIVAYDPQVHQLRCDPVSGQPSYVCGTGQASQPVMSVGLFYVVPQIPFGSWAQFPKTYDLTVTDLASKATGTVHTTVRPEADLALHGPYASNLGTHDAGIVVYLENVGPSDSQGATVTFTFSGAYTTFSFPIRDECTVSGDTVTCPLSWLQAGAGQVPMSVVMGHDSGVFSVTVRVVGDDADPDRANNGNIGGPWNLYPANGAPVGVPPPPPPPATVPHGAGVPVPAPAPSASATASPVPATSATAAAPVPAPARASSVTARWPLSHYLAIAFLCASSAYLAIAGTVWLGRRRRRSGATTDLDIDLDR
jgi:hypothetical protein